MCYLEDLTALSRKKQAKCWLPCMSQLDGSASRSLPNIESTLMTLQETTIYHSTVVRPLHPCLPLKVHRLDQASHANVYMYIYICIHAAYIYILIHGERERERESERESERRGTQVLLHSPNERKKERERERERERKRYA